MGNPSLSALAGESFVRLTTFRRSGEAVGTAVWVAADGDDLLVITTRHTGKVKRIAHTSRVTLAACDRRGRVRPGAPVVEAHAEVDASAATVARLRHLLVGKYAIQARLAMLAFRLRGVMKDQVAVRIRG